MYVPKLIYKICIHGAGKGGRKKGGREEWRGRDGEGGGKEGYGKHIEVLQQIEQKLD